MKSVYRIFFLITLLSSVCHATHFRGGEILSSHLSGQNFAITVRLYMEAANGATNGQQAVSVCFGDGSTADLPRKASTNIGNGIVVVDFSGTHNYSSSGSFQVSASIDNRVGQLLNVPNSNLTSGFLWTVINTQLANNTPVLPGLSLSAGIRQVFSIDLKPVVADNDSISVRVHRLSKASPGTCGVRMIDHTFMYPNEVSSSGTFRVEGTKLIWRAPELLGEYGFAMVVDEWRDGAKISETYREGVIVVTDKPGETIEVPPYVSSEGNNPVTSIPNVRSAEVAIAVEAYPVPTDNFVTVKAYSKKRAIIKLQLIDLNGRIIKEFSSRTPEIAIQEEFDMRNLAHGIYLIRADNSVDTATQKLVR